MSDLTPQSETPTPTTDKITQAARETIYLCNFRVSVDGEWLCLRELNDISLTPDPEPAHEGTSGPLGGAGSGSSRVWRSRTSPTVGGSEQVEALLVGSELVSDPVHQVNGFLAEGPVRFSPNTFITLMQVDLRTRPRNTRF